MTPKDLIEEIDRKEKLTIESYINETDDVKRDRLQIEIRQYRELKRWINKITEEEEEDYAMAQRQAKKDG